MRFLRSGRVRLTALVAVVVGLAAGGIAYASIPDSSGVIHGCYKTVGGALRVIDTDKGGKCVPSETALSWSQTGPKGATGAQGATGPTGPSGPGATSGTATLAQAPGAHLLVTLANGVSVKGSCSASGVSIDLVTSNALQATGTANAASTVSVRPVDETIGFAASFSDSVDVDFDGLARDSAVGNFAHLDVHGTQGAPCTYWWMIIPSS
jgi:hypothetical protein